MQRHAFGHDAHLPGALWQVARISQQLVRAAHIESRFGES